MDFQCQGCYAKICDGYNYLRIGQAVLCDSCFNDVRDFIIDELIEGGDLPDNFNG